MNAVAQIPADKFLDQVILALTTADAAALRRLEVAAPKVAAPADHAEYIARRAAFAALLAASARNLRFLRRVMAKQPCGPYELSLR